MQNASPAIKRVTVLPLNEVAGHPSTGLASFLFSGCYDLPFVT